ncbi:hypothetical protein ACWDBD_41250 [Streptomyces sp. NPDC001118]
MALRRAARESRIRLLTYLRFPSQPGTGWDRLTWLQAIDATWNSLVTMDSAWQRDDGFNGDRWRPTPTAESLAVDMARWAAAGGTQAQQ